MDKEILKGLADNVALFEVVKHVIRAKFLVEEIAENWSDEQIGQVIRAKITGLRKVEEGFKEIEKYKTIEDIALPDNPAR